MWDRGRGKGKARKLCSQGLRKVFMLRLKIISKVCGFEVFFLGIECKLLQFVFSIEVLEIFFNISLEISCYLVYFKFI